MLKGRRFLVADDAGVMRMLVRNWLEKLGAKVVEVDNGAEALQRARGDGFDGVFLDINMPQLNGLAVLTQLRKEPGSAGLPIFMLTTHGRAEDVLRGERLGATAYLTKPLSYGALVRALRPIFDPAREAHGEDEQPEAS
jgi:two-component system chemotaxis response regulator CheY